MMMNILGLTLVISRMDTAKLLVLHLPQRRQNPIRVFGGSDGNANAVFQALAGVVTDENAFLFQLLFYFQCIFVDDFGKDKVTLRGKWL